MLFSVLVFRLHIQLLHPPPHNYVASIIPQLGVAAARHNELWADIVAYCLCNLYNCRDSPNVCWQYNRLGHRATINTATDNYLVDRSYERCLKCLNRRPAGRHCVTQLIGRMDGLTWSERVIWAGQDVCDAASAATQSASDVISIRLKLQPLRDETAWRCTALHTAAVAKLTYYAARALALRGSCTLPPPRCRRSPMQ